MLIKIIIVVLFIAMVISLTSGMYFLFSDLGQKKRLLFALGLRITLAILLIGTIVYGIYSGQLVLNAPWHGQY
jgi:hypothetical protein